MRFQISWTNLIIVQISNEIDGGGNESRTYKVSFHINIHIWDFHVDILQIDDSRRDMEILFHRFHLTPNVSIER